jgi:hypothetical protein
MGLTHPAGTSSRSDGRVYCGPASRNGPAIQHVNAYYEKWKNKYTAYFFVVENQGYRFTKREEQTILLIWFPYRDFIRGFYCINYTLQ